MRDQTTEEPQSFALSAWQLRQNGICLRQTVLGLTVVGLQFRNDILNSFPKRARR